VIGLYIWLIVYFAVEVVVEKETAKEYTLMEFLNRISGLIWLEMIVVAFRRTMWVLIRIESEFFTNFEEFRDITIVPPIKKEE